MVVRELSGWKSAATVLTPIPVPSEKIGTRELHTSVAPSYPHIMEKSDNRRYPERNTDAPHLSAILFDDLDFLLEQHANGSSPGDDLEWFICRVKQKSLIHRSLRI
jgi:hypothetical protein